MKYLIVIIDPWGIVLYFVMKGRLVEIEGFDRRLFIEVKIGFVIGHIHIEIDRLSVEIVVDILVIKIL